MNKISGTTDNIVETICSSVFPHPTPPLPKLPDSNSRASIFPFSNPCSSAPPMGRDRGLSRAINITQGVTREPLSSALPLPPRLTNRTHILQTHGPSSMICERAHARVYTVHRHVRMCVCAANTQTNFRSEYELDNKLAFTNEACGPCAACAST